MKLLILGRMGQVGQELVRSLAPIGEVTALGRTQIDLLDTPKLRSLVTEVSPDVIINAAAYTAVDRAEIEPSLADRINHHALTELAEIAAQRGAWLIHYSTDYVFDGKASHPYTEESMTRPINVYGKSKLDGEKSIAASGARHLIFRTSWIHSGHGNNFVRTILRLAAERDVLRVVVDQVGAPTSAELVADVTAHALGAIHRGAAPASGIYHLTAKGETTWHGLATFAMEAGASLGKPMKAVLEAVSSAEYGASAARPLNCRLNTNKICRELNLVMPDWRLHVERTVAQLMSQP